MSSSFTTGLDSNVQNGCPNQHRDLDWINSSSSYSLPPEETREAITDVYDPRDRLVSIMANAAMEKDDSIIFK